MTKPNASVLVEAIEQASGNVSAIAAAFGVSRTAIYQWIEATPGAADALKEIRVRFPSEVSSYQSKVRASSANKKSTLVYLIQESWKGYCKIGITKNLVARIAAISSSCPQDIELLGYFESEHAYVHERKLHERFAHKHIKGEWFDLDEDDIHLILNYHNAHTTAVNTTQLNIFSSVSTE
jgi:transposase-like protein